MNMAVDPLLRVDRITKRVGNRKVLDDVSFDVGHREIVGICGARGAGKRKLLDIITGSERADGGRIFLGATDVTNLSTKKRRLLGISSQLQEAPMLIRLREAVRARDVENRLGDALAGAGTHHRQGKKELVEDMMSSLGLLIYRKKTFPMLSAGVRQRVLLGEMLIGKPKLIVLDEPFKALDHTTFVDFEHLLRHLGSQMSILLSDRSGQSHRVCNKLYFLEDGKITIGEGTTKIFLSYRRADEAGFAQAIFQQLQGTFDPRQLFLDVEGYIEPGEDYASALREHAQKCDVFLALIGPRWLNAVDDGGNRRLDNPTDWVRIEIISALEAGKQVIPVLVGGAEMPREDELAEPLRPLCRRQAVRISAEGFKSDAQRLVRYLQSLRVGQEA